jgi:hypothetical protein
MEKPLLTSQQRKLAPEDWQNFFLEEAEKLKPDILN